MLPVHIAVVSEISAISTAELTQVAAALQKQVMRDFGPIWNVRASVDAFTRLEDVPIGYWPIIIEQDIQTPSAAGIHKDKDGQPFSLVAYNSSWALTASHECLEMLADSSGNRLIAGQSPKNDQGRVEFLVEVCDPIGDVEFAYTVNGVLVSDFYTPNFFDPVQSTGVRYSFTGAVTSPRQVLKGGYLSWHEPITNHWWQLRFFDTEQEFHDVGILGQTTGSLREAIDSITAYSSLIKGFSPQDSRLLVADARKKAIEAAANRKAAAWREQIEVLKAKT